MSFFLSGKLNELLVRRELSVLPEKYDAQYVQLAQTLGAEVLMEAAEDEEDYMSRSANSQLINFRISILLNFNNSL